MYGDNIIGGVASRFGWCTADDFTWNTIPLLYCHQWHLGKQFSLESLPLSSNGTKASYFNTEYNDGKLRNLWTLQHNGFVFGRSASTLTCEWTCFLNALGNALKLTGRLRFVMEFVMNAECVEEMAFQKDALTTKSIGCLE